jgi:hypothetical protein
MFHPHIPEWCLVLYQTLFVGFDSSGFPWTTAALVAENICLAMVSLVLSRK